MSSLYLVGFILYCVSVVLSYSAGFKSSPWFIPAGLVLALAVNYLWLYIAKMTTDQHQLYLRGIYWDAMIVGCYVLIPIACYSVRFKQTTAIGICLIIAGLILTKV